MVAFCSRPLPPISRSISFSQILWKYRIHPRAIPNNQGFLDWNIMGRPKGSRNKRTLLREAEQFVGSKYVDQVLDSLYVIEKAAQHSSFGPRWGSTPAATRYRWTRTTSKLLLLLP